MRRWLVVATLVGVIIAGETGRLASARGDGPPEPALWSAVGVLRNTSPSEAPPFSLRDFSGAMVSLRELRGRVVLLYFWATW